MKPMDIFVEKQARDRSYDSANSRSLSREVNNICRRERLDQSKTLTTKDKMSLASASIMLGSPFFLFSLGTTFAVVDEYDRMVNDKMGQAKNQKRTAGIIQDAEVADQCEKKVLVAAASGPMLMSLDFVGKVTQTKQQDGRCQRKDQAVFSDSSRNTISNFLAGDQSWLTARKLLKQKFLLMDQVEKVNGHAEFSLVAGLIAQIEILDKALKKLGC